MNPLDRLRGIPAFVEFAHAKMLTDRVLFEHEAESGTGIVQAVARAVVEIGGDRHD